ncbi:hypothetical protein AHAS_Ahas19G0273100 [Arachis hypogaea]
MTTNISECINAVMKGSRNSPITTLVKSSYFRLGELFARKGSEALTQLQIGAEFSQTLVKTIEFNSKHVNTMNVYQFDRLRTNFTVEELAAVLLNEGTCDCGYFQALHLPCRHVLAACSHARLDWKSFIHPVYRIESVFNVYRSEFRPRPNPRMMRVKRGRPVSSRIRNNMDDVEHNGEKQCRLCFQNGHTRRTCTALDGGGASSSRR